MSRDNLATLGAFTLVGATWLGTATACWWAFGELTAPKFIVVCGLVVLGFFIGRLAYRTDSR